MSKILADIFPNGISITDLKPPPPLPPDTQLRTAIADAGLTPPDEIIFDGKLRRFSTNGKRSDMAGWYVAFDDGKGPAGGAFGDWRQGVETTWRADIGRELSIMEQHQIAQRMRELKAQREREIAVLRQEAAEDAATIWADSPLASDQHPYFVRKGISNPGLKLHTDGRLIAPVYVGDELTSLQFIAGDGKKLFLKGGRTAGGWWLIGGGLSADAKRVYVAEGIATAQSIFEATGKPVAVAYSAGNMPATAQAVREIVGPLCEVVVVADNDESGTGQREGAKAAESIGGRLVIPPELGDANDYAQAGGDLGALLEPLQETPEDGALAALQVVMASDLPDEYTPPDELVQGLLTTNSMSVIYGDSNSGKTFFTIDMAAAIALGRDWMGRKTEQGLVVFLATESPSSVRTRLQAYQKHHGVVIEHFAIVQSPVNFFNNAADCVSVIKAIRALEAKHGIKCRMVVGDTLARISAGANENSGEDMGPVMARFDSIRQHTGAHVNVIHHNGKDQAKGARGWSGIRAHIDTEIELAEEDGRRIATITKQRELPGKMSEIHFNLQVVKLGLTKWGDDATSCIVVPMDAEDVQRMEIPKESKTLATFRKYFESAVLAHGRLDSKLNRPFISADAWAEFSRTKPHETEGARRAYLSKVKKTLVAAGYIEEANGGYVATDHDALAGAFLGLHRF